MTWEIATRVEVDEGIIKVSQKVSLENGEHFNKDLQTLNSLNCCHHKELDAHTEALNKMEEWIKGLCCVVNRQMTHMWELQEVLDTNNNIIETQQVWIAKMRGWKECNCGLVDPLLATVSGVGVEDSEEDEDEDLKYVEAETPGTSLGTGGLTPTLSSCLARTKSSASNPIPGWFPDDVSLLRIIEDCEYIEPPVVLSDCGCLEKENKVLIQVPTPVPSPMILWDQAVCRSPHSLKLGRDPSPYVLHSVLFSGARTLDHPVVHHHSLTYQREHQVVKITPSQHSPDPVGCWGCDSGELDTWRHKYSPSPSNYDWEWVCQGHEFYARF